MVPTRAKSKREVGAHPVDRVLRFDQRLGNLLSSTNCTGLGERTGCVKQGGRPASADNDSPPVGRLDRVQALEHLRRGRINGYKPPAHYHDALVAAVGYQHCKLFACFARCQSAPLIAGCVIVVAAFDLPAVVASFDHVAMVR